MIMTKPQTERLAQVPPMYRTLFQRVYAGQIGRAAQVKAKCLDCTCYQRVEITNCQATACPLHAIRPYQNDEDQSHQDAGISA